MCLCAVVGSRIYNVELRRIPEKTAPWAKKNVLFHYDNVVFKLGKITSRAEI